MNQPIGYVDSNGLWVAGGGIGAEIAAFFGVESSLTLVTDDDGNVGLAFTGGGSAGVQMAVSPPSPQWFVLPALDNIFDLNGFVAVFKARLGVNIDLVGVNIDDPDSDCPTGVGGDFDIGLGFGQGFTGTGVLPLGNYKDRTGLFDPISVFSPILGLVKYYLGML